MQQLQKCGHFAKVCRSKTINRIQEGDAGSNTESWPEIDHIQSVNSINRVDFYKEILLEEVQPIEFIIDTGSPETIIPPIINRKDIKTTSKCSVDVNKNPINFRGEAMLEVTTERKKVTLPILITEKENTQPLPWTGLAKQTGDWFTREMRDEHHPKHNRQQKR